MAFDLSSARPVSEIGGFDISTSAPVEKKIQGASPRNRRANKLRAERKETESLLSQFEAGEITSKDLTENEVERVRKARIDAIPEITGSFERLSKNLSFTDALAAMTSFDPDEFGRILQASDPEIGVVTTPEGERIAVNRKTNEAFSINKTGPSLMDAVQFGGSMSALTPSGMVQGIGRQAALAAGTQAAIEGAQAASGGDFNAEDVALAGVAVPITAGVVKAGKGAIESFRRSIRASEPLIDTATGAIQPSFKKALDKYKIDAGALMDDHANLPVIYSGDKPSQVVEQIIKKQINTGKKSSYLAELRLDNKGNIVDDELGILARKQGFDRGDIQAVKQANQATRKEAQRMLRMQRAIMSDKSNVDSFRPSDAVGDSVLDRLNYVRKEADNLANSLDKMASKELTISGRNLIGEGKDRLKGLPIDPSRVEITVFDELEKIGITGLDGTTPIFDKVLEKGFFEGSDIAVDKTSQRIVRDVFKLLRHNPDGPIDALKAHKVKRQIDTLIDYNKKSSQGLTESGRRFAMAVRRSMNDSIRDVSPKYAKVNDDLSLALGAINDLENSVGRRIDLFDKNANQAMGTEMRKLLSNYGTRQTLGNALNTVDDVAKQLGGVFKTDFRELNRFANVLDKRFGSVAENSFKGNIDSALDLNRLRSTSVKEAVVEKGLSKIADRFGPNDQKAMDAMQKILVRGK